MVDMGVSQEEIGDFRGLECERGPFSACFALLHAAVDEELHAVDR